MVKLFRYFIIAVSGIILLLWPGSFAARSGSETVYLAEMKQCPGRVDLPIMGLNFTLDRINRTQNYLNGDIVMKESFPTGFKGIHHRIRSITQDNCTTIPVNVNIKSCEDMTDKSTCKPFLNQIATSELCLLLKKPLPSYRTFIRSMSPALQCPLRNTTYQIRNFQVPNELAKYMQRSSKRIYYFNRISGTKNGREIVCFEFFMYAAAVKKS